MVLIVSLADTRCFNNWRCVDERDSGVALRGYELEMRYYTTDYNAVPSQESFLHLYFSVRCLSIIRTHQTGETKSPISAPEEAIAAEHGYLPLRDLLRSSKLI